MVLFDLLQPRSSRGLVVIAGGLSLAGAFFLNPLVPSWGTRNRSVLRGKVSSLSFSPDGRHLAVGRTHGLIEIWSIEHATLENQWAGAGRNMIFGSNSTTLALSSGRELLLWNTRSRRKRMRALAGHHRPITEMCASPDRRLLATADRRGYGILWNLETDAQTGTFRLRPASLRAVIDHADGAQLLSAAGPDKLRLLSLDSAKPNVIRTFVLGVPILAFDTSPDGRRLVASGKDKQGGWIAVWDTTSGRVLARRQTDQVAVLRFHPDSVRVACVGSEVELWNSDSDEVQPFQMDDRRSHTACRFSPDGRSLAVGSDEDSRVWLYDVANGKLARILDVE